MSVKSIGFIGRSAGDYQEYDFPSIQVGKSGQIIRVKESNAFDTASLEAQIEALEDQITADNIVVETLNEDISELQTEVNALIINEANLVEQQANISQLLLSLQTTINQISTFVPNTTLISSFDTGLRGRASQSAYYFQPNFPDTDYQAILSTPDAGMSLSTPSSPSVNTFLFTWIVNLFYFNPLNSGEPEYIKNSGMLYVTLRGVNNEIYYQVKDGNFAFLTKDQGGQASVMGSGSGLVTLPAGTQTFFPSIFVSSHNQSGVDANPIKSNTSWGFTTSVPEAITSSGNQPYTVFSLIKI
jgi:hypothetical protein